MKTTTTRKKRSYKGRNTGLFYGYLKCLAGYEAKAKDDIAHGVIDCYLTGKYGERHGRRVSLSGLTDTEYAELLDDLIRQAGVSTDPDRLARELNEKAVRKDWYHRILQRLSRIGVCTTNGYDEVNRHIRSLPVSRGRILPAMAVEELPELFKAVCSYCDNVLKKQREEQAIAGRN